MEKTFTWALKPFSTATPANALLPQIDVTVRANFPRLNLQYRVHPAPVGLDASLTPNLQPPAFAQDLWKTNCFELFIKTCAAKDYHEWNLSPDAKRFAHFEFANYRSQTPTLAGASGRPEMLRSTRTSSFLLEATLDLSFSPLLSWAWINGLPLQIHPTVILELAGQLTYWAPAHPQAKADFHDASVYSTVAWGGAFP